MANPAFEIFEDKGGGYRFYFRRGDGERLLSSEGFTTIDHCENGIRSVEKNTDLGQFELMAAKNGRYFFVQKDMTHRVISTSVIFWDKDAAKKAIQEVRRLVRIADIDVVSYPY